MTPTPTRPSDPLEGWGFPGTSRKYHYFIDMMSLCRKWGFYRGPLTPENGKLSSDDCAACRRAVDKRTLDAMDRAAIANSGEAS